MGKLKKRKERIKLNDIVNEKLDSMEDNSALEVFTPKKDSNIYFRDLASSAIEDELKESEKNNVKSNMNNLNGLGKIICIALILGVFFFSIYILYNFLFL